MKTLLNGSRILSGQSNAAAKPVALVFAALAVSQPVTAQTRTSPTIEQRDNAPAGDMVTVGGMAHRDVASAAPVLGLDREALERLVAATGLVECGGVRATGQLTGRGDQVTSTAHTFFDEAGRERGACTFTVRAGGELRRFTLGRVSRSGSNRPYANAGQNDWAVARLDRSIDGIAPYRIGPPPKVGQPIMMVTSGVGRTLSVGLCRVRRVVGGGDGPREIRTDCSSRNGMSGAAYLTAGPQPSLIGLHVGYRSADPAAPRAYSDTHYTFGASAEGAFRRAVSE